MTKTSWISTSAATTYVPREKPIQESLAPFSSTFSGAVPSTQIRADNTGQRILAIDGTWIPQPAFTSGGSDQIETLRPSVISPSYSANPPTVTDSAKAYDSDTNHATTFGQWYAAPESRTNNRVDIFSLTTWASKTQTWTAATINVSRSYAILQDGESSATSGSSSKTSSVKYEFSIDNGSNWTTLGTDTQSSIPTAPQTLSMALGSLTPTMGNILVKVTITRGGGGTIYEDGVSLPGLTGEIDLKLFDVWIDGTYAGGAGNITCNNLTVTGDATFQNKIYDSTASSGSTGQVLKVASNGKVEWATDSAGTGTVTSITTTGANGVTISGGSTQTITTSGTFALALGNITPTSISTGTGSFSGDVEFAASIKSPNGSNSPVTIVPDGTGDLHVNADSLRLGDNNANATIATNGTGDLILTTHEGSATEGVIRLYDGANGNITLTPNGTGQVQVGSDQVVTLTASQTLTNKTLSTGSVWNGNTIGVAYGGTGLTTLTAGYIPYGNGTSAFGSSANLFWDSTNSRLGIGTSSPSAGLSVYKGSAGVLATLQGGGTACGFAQNVVGGANTLEIQTQDTTTGTLATRYLIRGGTDNANHEWYAGARGSETAKMFLDSTNGFLGIGTITPASRLMISGTGTGAWFTVNRTDSGTNIIDFTASGSRLGYVGYNGSDLYLNQASAANTILFTNNTERMRIDSSGNVGIGTSSPSAKLTVNSGANRQIYIGQNTSNTNYNAISLNGSLSDSGLMGLAGGGTGDETLYVMSQGNMVFRTVGTNERMRIDSNGNVGIGTSTVVANFGGYKTLELNGTTGGLLSLDSNGTNNLQMYTNGSTVNVVTIGALPLTFGTNSTERMRITSGGELLIGNTTGTEKLTVTGKIKASDVLLGNNGTKGYGAITTTTSTSTPTGGSSGDHYYIY